MITVYFHREGVRICSRKLSLEKVIKIIFSDNQYLGFLKPLRFEYLHCSEKLFGNKLFFVLNCRWLIYDNFINRLTEKYHCTWCLCGI